MAVSRRRCIVCRAGAEKGELLRFVWLDGKVTWDKEQKLPGRGAYTHGRWTCVCRFGELGLWAKAFRLGDTKLTINEVKEALASVRQLALRIDEPATESQGVLRKAKGKVRL